MSKILLVFLVLAGLITFVHAQDTADNASNSNAGIIAGLLVTGSLSAIGLYFLCRRKNRNNREVQNHGQETIDIDYNDNLQNYIIQVVKNMNNSNPGQVLESESQIHNDQATPAAASANNEVHNHGQETIDINNNNNLQNYIARVVKQSMNNSNPEQVLESESQSHNDQATPAASTNNEVHNHGQEAIPIS